MSPPVNSSSFLRIKVEFQQNCQKDQEKTSTNQSTYKLHSTGL